MKKTRREFLLKLMAQLGTLGAIAAMPSSAAACLAGKWRVRCPNGHIDTVDQVTCNHNCETCSAVAFSDGEGDVVCPDNHVNHVRTGNKDQRDQWLTSLKCSQCGKECCASATAKHSRPDIPDHH